MSCKPSSLHPPRLQVGKHPNPMAADLQANASWQARTSALGWQPTSLVQPPALLSAPPLQSRCCMCLQEKCQQTCSVVKCSPSTHLLFCTHSHVGVPSHQELFCRPPEARRVDQCSSVDPPSFAYPQPCGWATPPAQQLPRRPGPQGQGCSLWSARCGSSAIHLCPWQRPPPAWTPGPASSAPAPLPAGQ